VDYRVELDVFNGPMDLLLYLIKRDELDIYDIPIARITDSYLGYVNMLRGMKEQAGLDINVAGDFLVMAATLMEIKSAMLLPRAPASQADGETSTAEELADPRYELIRKLLEYKRIKDAATCWSSVKRSTTSGFRACRPRRRPTASHPRSTWRRCRSGPDGGIQQADAGGGGEKGDVPRGDRRRYADRPARGGHRRPAAARRQPADAARVDRGAQEQGRDGGVFLALLELIRQKRILVRQDEAGDEIEIVSAPEEHRRTYEEAPLHLATEDEPRETGATKDKTQRHGDTEGESAD